MLESLKKIERIHIPDGYELSHLHLAEILEAGKLNFWDVDLATGHVIDFGYSESLAKQANFQPGFDNIVTFFERVHPEDRDRVKDILNECYLHFTDYRAEFRILLLNGEYVWVSALGRYVINDNGIATRMIGTWRFITEYKRNLELVQMQRTLLDKLSRSHFVGELTATVSHQISQPLLIINTYVSTCLRRLQENSIDKNELIDVLSITNDQIAMANRAIKRIKQFITQGTLKYEKADINALIHSATPLIDFYFEHKIKTNIDIQEGLSQILLDRNQIRQVINNLINNATEAMHQANQLNPEITIRAYENNNNLEISIIDNGPGISDESLENLFVPFFSTKSQGMGIGLSICRTVIELHGGRISIKRNEESQGTFAQISLPMNREMNHA